jgi:hypothetical protein
VLNRERAGPYLYGRSGNGYPIPIIPDEECIMKRNTFVVCTLLGALLLPAGFTMAADPPPAQAMTEAQGKEQIYGSQLMSQEERTEYHSKMRAAKTDEERELLRKEHHQDMQERAKSRGVTLPDEPPVRGGGMGMGPGGDGMMGNGKGNR